MPRRLLTAAVVGAATLALAQCGGSWAFVTTLSSFGVLRPPSTQMLLPLSRPTRTYPSSRFSLSRSRTRTSRVIPLSSSRRNTDRGSFSWDESVLDKAVKDMLVERAVDTLRHFWNETGGDIYGQWLDRFTVRQNLGDDVISTMGWARFLIKMMREEPVEVVVIRTARKDSPQVQEVKRKNNERPPTLSPWRHSVNQLSADWDAEDEEEMKVELDYPPQLKAVKKAVVVQPVEIAKKLMDIREQLALEWVEDLKNVKAENDEIIRVNDERRILNDEEEVQKGRRLTYDHGEAFGGDSSPFRSGNYEALVGYLTEIGALAVQERMRVNGDEMGWNWMEQFLYWAKTNSKSGTALHGDEPVGPPPPPPPSESGEGGSNGVVGEGRGARGKRVNVAFGAVMGVGMGGTEEDRKMRGNCMLEEMMLGTKVQTYDFEKKCLVGADPAEICRSVMEARLGVAERISTVLEAVPDDHGLVLRRYLEDKWQSPDRSENEPGDDTPAGDEG